MLSLRNISSMNLRQSISKSVISSFLSANTSSMVCGVLRSASLCFTLLRCASASISNISEHLISFDSTGVAFSAGDRYYVARQIPEFRQPILNSDYSQYPNPFNGVTTLPLHLHKAHNVNVSIYNINGQLVKTLFEGTLEVDLYKFLWDGRDKNGNQVTSGVYLIHVDMGTKKIVNRVSLLR